MTALPANVCGIGVSCRQIVGHRANLCVRTEPIVFGLRRNTEWVRAEPLAKRVEYVLHRRPQAHCQPMKDFCLKHECNHDEWREESPSKEWRPRRRSWKFRSHKPFEDSLDGFFEDGIAANERSQRLATSGVCQSVFGDGTQLPYRRPGTLGHGDY